MHTFGVLRVAPRAAAAPVAGRCAVVRAGVAPALALALAHILVFLTFFTAMMGKLDPSTFKGFDARLIGNTLSALAVIIVSSGIGIAAVEVFVIAYKMGHDGDQGEVSVRSYVSFPPTIKI